MTENALSGVRVVGIGTDDAGAFATRLLADLGADVVEVTDERACVVAASRGDLEHDGLREFFGWNKRSAHAEALDRLLPCTDVVVLALPPSELRRRRLAPEQLRTRLPRAVLTYVTPFGLTGPLAEHRAGDLVLQATSGCMAISGSSAREPLKHGLRTSTYAGGLNAAWASVAALRSVERTGAGVVLDLALRDCLSSELVMNHAFREFTGVVQRRPPPVGDPLDGHPVGGPRGYVSLQTSARQGIERWARFFDDGALLDAAFATPELRVVHADRLRAVLAGHLDHEAPGELFERGAGEGLVLGFVQGAGDMLHCPHLEARGIFVDVRSRDGRSWKLPAQLAKLSATPTSVRRTAPSPGAHTDEVLREWAPRPVEPVRPVDEPAGPYAGIRVLDLSVIFAVPYMAGLLADLGADVIKIEAPRRLDQTRTDWGGYLDNDPGQDPWNRSGTFHVVNRGKRSLSLDLSRVKGREVLLRLVAQADVLLDNFTPRVLRGWGLTYDTLREVNPGLVMLSNTGFGSTGPWASFKAQGTTLEATMGLMAVTGYEDGPPSRAGQSVPDFYACWAGLLAIAAALHHRDRTGAGQHVDLGMYQLGASITPEALIHHQTHGSDPVRRGARDVGDGFSGVVPAAGNDRWLALSTDSPADGSVLRRLVSPRPAEFLEDAVRRWAGDRDVHEATSVLQGLGIAAGPVNDADDLARDPQLRARGFFEPVDLREAGRRDVIGRPFRWESSTSRVGVAGPAPDFGFDNDAVLRGLLGLASAEVAALREGGVVTDAPVDPVPARPMDIDLLAMKGTVVRRATGRPVVSA